MNRKNNFLFCFLLFFSVLNVFRCAFASDYEPIGKEEIKAMLLTEEGITKGHELDADDLVEAVKEIKKETVDIKITGCMIKNDLDFMKLGVNELDEQQGTIYTINNKISITFSFLNDRINSTLGKFNKSVNFCGSTFLESADFSLSYFSFFDASYGPWYQKKASADFGNAKFLKGARFCWTKFSGKVDFLGTQFKKGVDFSRCEFGGPAYFSEAYFKDSSTNSAL